MKVCNSYNVFNHDVSSALKYVSEIDKNNDGFTTAWFVEVIHKWLKLLFINIPFNHLGFK
jgi:hypothetical protein